VRTPLFASLLVALAAGCAHADPPSAPVPAATSAPAPAATSAPAPAATSAPVPAATSGPRTVQLEDADDGRAVHLAAGDALVVRLVVQMGTGYGWTAKTVPSALRRGEGPVDEPPDATHTEHQRFRFEATTRGGGALVLELRRPWNKTEPAAKTFHATITVD
jgi:predicted secreted protein